MPRGTPYTPCKLFYDGAADLEAGDFLKTPAGSAYLVQASRRSKARKYRQYLDCLRWPKAEIPQGARVHALHWYKRSKRAGTSFQSHAA